MNNDGAGWDDKVHDLLQDAVHFVDVGDVKWALHKVEGAVLILEDELETRQTIEDWERGGPISPKDAPR